MPEKRLNSVIGQNTLYKLKLGERRLVRTQFFFTWVKLIEIHYIIDANEMN